jgi:hypothetical protein
MTLEKIIDKIKKDNNQNDSELLIKNLILNLTNVHLESQNKKLITWEQLIHFDKELLSRNKSFDIDGYAPRGFNQLHKKTIIKIINCESYFEIVTLLKTKNFWRSLPNKNLDIEHILIIAPQYIHWIDKSYLMVKFNVLIWDMGYLESLYKRYRKEINNFKKDIINHVTQRRNKMIDLDKIKFKTYQWSIGTTSFRVSELKYKIEKQLLLLKELFLEYPNKSWQELQSIYFDSLVKNKLAQETASKPKKDARQKTSALKDLGLINEERRLTEVGERIYEIAKNQDYNNDNEFFIRNDSFIYLKQFLKLELTNSSYFDFKIKPFLTLLYACAKLEYITKDELVYIIPLAKTTEELKEDVRRIKESRESGFNIDNLIRQKISEMDNYQEALNLLQSKNNISMDDFLITMMNRKSPKYAKKYYKLYKEILNYNHLKPNLNNNQKKEKLFNIIKVIKDNFGSSKAKPKIFESLINTTQTPRTSNSISNDNITFFENTNLMTANSLNQFKEEFFYTCHICKWKANLEEYYDLNKRFITLTDIFLIKDNKIKLDTIPHFYFKKNIDNLIEEDLLYDYNEAEYFNEFYSNQEDLKAISKYLNVDLNELYTEIKAKYPDVSKVGNLKDQLKEIITNQRVDRFNNLIASHFNRDQLTKLLINIRDRNDDDVKDYIEWDADIPTIFEYLIGISWYLISGQKGDLSNFLNLKLDANLLPVRFANGGMGDIEFEYFDHDLIIEVTLTENTNQRRLELEPVTRHLGKYMMDKNNNSYAIFIAPYLDPNVLVNFRAYKDLKFYNTIDTSQFVEGLKIIPLSIDDITDIINNSLNYKSLKDILDQSFNHPEIDGFKWYNEVLKPRLNRI